MLKTVQTVCTLRFQAKQRYNDRVKKAVVGFLALKAPLEAGDINALREYFASEDAGSWKDFTSAGYLLANAFRRNSSAAPDTLPSVKVRTDIFTKNKLTIVLLKPPIVIISSLIHFTRCSFARLGKSLHLTWKV